MKPVSTEANVIRQIEEREAAEQILSRDPFREHGSRTAAVERWQLKQGPLGEQISLSDQRYEFL